MIGRDLKTPVAFDNPEVRLWFYKLERGIKRRKREERRWEKNYDHEDLKHWNGDEGGQDEPTINKLGSWINTRISAIAYRNPRFTLTPVNADGYEPVLVPMIDPQRQRSSFSKSIPASLTASMVAFRA